MFVDAIRSLGRSRAIPLFVVFLLALTIAAATVTFSVVDAVVLRPLPFPDPEALAVIEHPRNDGLMSHVRVLAPSQFLTLRERSAAFESLAAVRRGSSTLSEGEPERIWSAAVTASLFDVLRVRPMLGQAFTEANEAAGSDSVAVIAHSLWTRRFGGDRSIVGRMIRTTTGTLQVVGVMPPEFSYPLVDDRIPEMWTPYVIPPDERGSGNLSTSLHVVGRLKRDAALAQAQAQADAIRQALANENPRSYPSSGRFTVIPLHEWTVGAVRGWMVLVLIAVGLVLLIACANVANLLLTRAMARTRELSIRSALGASRGRLFRMLLAESVLLSAAAAALGILISWWGVEAVRHALPSGIARSPFIAVNARVLGAAAITALFVSVSVGLLAGFFAARKDVIAGLKAAAANLAPARARWRHAVVIAEVAFASVLLVATALFVTSFVRLTRADLGFDRSHLLLVSAPGGPMTLAEFVARLKGVPGIAAVGGAAAGSPPLVQAGFEGGSSGTLLRLPDAASEVLVEFNRVTPEYFAAAGMPLLKGRAFAYSELAPSMSRKDLARASLVVLDERAARQLFGDRDPLGREVLYGDSRATVIGVVANVKMRGPEADTGPQAYFAGPVNASSYAYLVRTARPPLEVAGGVRALVSTMQAPGARPAQVRLIEDAFRNITARRRFSAQTMIVFGVLALLIGASGVYAVMSSLVTQRTREFGVRMALGASPARMVGQVLAQLAVYVGAGLAVGLPLAWIVSRAFDVVFYEVRPTDAWIYGLVAVLLAFVGIASASIPARRASRVDPIVALRAE